MIRVKTKSEQQTEALGQALAGVLPGRCLVFLKGGLGVGKTALARGVARGLGITRNVASPTFTLVNEYQGPAKRLVHMDLYRVLGQPLEDLGLDDYFAQPGVCLVEWPDALEAWERPDVVVEITTQGETGRTIDVTAGKALEKKIEEALPCAF